MSWTYFTYTKENVSIDDMQKIIDEFPDDWIRWRGNRNEKPTRQDWGWSTIVDIGNPWHNWKDDDYGYGIVGVATVSGASFSSDYGEEVNRFVVDKLKEFGYTILYEYLN
jgi:hypothetical protein